MVDIAISSQIENMFLAREAKDKDTKEAIDQDQSKAKKGSEEYVKGKKESKGRKTGKDKTDVFCHLRKADNQGMLLRQVLLAV